MKNLRKVCVSAFPRRHEKPKQILFLAQQRTQVQASRDHEPLGRERPSVRSHK
jgi:hypothetical protein